MHNIPWKAFTLAGALAVSGCATQYVTPVDISRTCRTESKAGSDGVMRDTKKRCTETMRTRRAGTIRYVSPLLGISLSEPTEPSAPTGNVLDMPKAILPKWIWQENPSYTL